jgi:AmmeMemoRadiSam system protein A
MCIQSLPIRIDMDELTAEERKLLLTTARQSISLAVNRLKPQSISIEDYPHSLQQWGASFVTLTKKEILRGCVGTLEAYQPLVEDVREHAIAAAMHDYRFPPVQADEIDDLNIEISRLTSPVRIDYQDPIELVQKLRPGIDGVLLRDGFQRATFLPQVWEKLPGPDDFLSHLCLKMGSSANLWKRKLLEISTYQVEEFHES